MTFQIYNFDHDPLAAGGGNAAITFGMRDLMSTARQMNTTNTNAGSFSGSTLNAWLTGDLWNQLPADLRAVIKPVNKITSEGGNPGTGLLTESMSVFLFSQAEYSDSISGVTPGQGTQYPIFTDNASRIKRLSNGAGNANWWWGRSPTSGSNVGFRSVNISGTISNSNASGAAGVCFGFCV